LEAKLFGGARLIDGLTDIGDQNAAFAERFLRDEGIRFTGGSLRGISPGASSSGRSAAGPARSSWRAGRPTYSPTNVSAGPRRVKTPARWSCF